MSGFKIFAFIALITLAFGVALVGDAVAQEKPFVIVLDRDALDRSDRNARVSGEMFGIHPGEHSKLACVAFALYDSPVFVPSEDILVLGKSGIGTKANPVGTTTTFAGTLRPSLINTKAPEFRAETLEEFKKRNPFKIGKKEKEEEEEETPPPPPPREPSPPPPPREKSPPIPKRSGASEKKT